jgi:hypothetical protein
MLRSDRVYLALALVTAVATAATATTGGCGGGGKVSEGTGGKAGSTSSTSSTTGTGGTGGGTGGGDSGVPCAPPTVLAVNTLDLGAGTSGQWKTLGFNLDGLVSTATSTNLCQLNSGAVASDPYPDGNDGIDNSFGKNLLPLILDLDSTWTTDINTSIQQGNFTALLELECLPPTGDVSVLTTKLFAGTTLGTAPKWDGTDQWPVEPDLLTNPKDPQSSSLVFPQCSVTGTTFSAGKNGTIVLTIPVMTSGVSTSIKLTLYAAQLTMTLSADRLSATNGMIGGVLNTEEFVTQVNNIGVLLGLCGSSILTNLVTQVRQASDIMADGTQDTTKTCDGISVGLGFTMLPAQIGIVGPAAPAEMTCP